MGNISRLLQNAPEPKRVTVEVDGETFEFACANPGETMGESYLVTAKDLDLRAAHYELILGAKIKTDTVRMAKLIVGTIQGEAVDEKELVQLFLKRPLEFLKLANAANEVLGITPDAVQSVDPTTAVGAGNSPAAVESA